MNWRKLNFRDIMSLVPTSVSILSYIETDFVFGCTISSLVSVNIDEKNPEIVFVLKKESLIGEKIRAGTFFTINVLSFSQDVLAEKYSMSRDPELKSEKPWKINNNFAEINDARVILNCNLVHVYSSHASNIFVGAVLKYYGNAGQPALIYNARAYGKFKSN